MLRVLSIGNSFSASVCNDLPALAAAEGRELAYANLFMNDRACRAFEEAYALLKDNTIRKRIYFLSLTEPVIGLRERYSAAAGSDIPPEWDAEYEEARLRAAEGPRRREIREIFEKDPVRRQQGTAELIRRWKQDYRSML